VVVDETAPADALEAASLVVLDETPPAAALVNAVVRPKASAVVLDEPVPLDVLFCVLVVEFCFQPPTPESMVQPPLAIPEWSCHLGASSAEAHVTPRPANTSTAPQIGLRIKMPPTLRCGMTQVFLSPGKSNIAIILFLLGAVAVVTHSFPMILTD
jgi:hypothetical protein